MEKQRTCKIGQWIWLNSIEDLYYISSGEVELYAVCKNAQGADVRKYFQTAAKGELICGMPLDRPVRILALVTKSAQLDSIAWKQMYDSKQFVVLFDCLLQKFFSRPYNVLLPKVCKEILLDCKEEIPANTNLTFSKEDGVCWIEILSGKIKEEQQEKLIENGPVMVLEHKEAVTTESDCVIRSYRTLHFIKTKSCAFLKLGLQQEMERFSHSYEAYFKQREIFYEQRLAEHRQEKELLVSNSYRELMKNLIPDLPVVIRPEDKNQPAAVYALQQIGGFFGIKKRKIKLSQEFCHLANTDEIVRLIAGSSDLYGRKVLLEEEWHCRDQGPLLVFYRGKPFAALPFSAKRYELIDLEQGNKIPVTDEVAAQCAKQGYTFYRNMPEYIDNLKKWVIWAGKLSWAHDYWLLFFACLIVGFIPVITPLITQTVFHDIIPSYDKQAHLMVIQVMLVTSVAGALTNLVRNICVMRIKNHIRTAAESALWIKLLSLPAAFFRRYQIGDLALRMQGIGQISGQFSSLIANGIFNGLFCFWNIVVMVYFSYKLALLALLIWGVYFMVSVFLSWRLVRFQRRKAEAGGAVSGQVLQLLNGLNKFKLRAAEERAFYLWTRKFGDQWHWNRRTKWQNNWLDLLNQSQPLVMNFFIFFLTMTLFDDGIKTGVNFLSQANFLSFNSAMGSFGSVVAGLLSGIMGLMGIVPELERIRPILKEKAEVTENKLPAGELSGEIEVCDLQFRYKQGLPLVLKNVSLKIKQGMFVAVVGSSGSGKSTLLRVLLGLEKPEKGFVQFDGQDLGQLDVTSVRRQIGVVMQHGQLLAGSIYSNIIGALPLSLDDAWEAAKLVGLDADIKEMPMGMHTIVSEGAGNISGGQKQRILIARSIVNHPRIVVFDEATSSLDNAVQSIVAESLEKMQSTRIIVAHRLSTIRRADRIIVMDKGEIAEMGTYEQLMAKGGLFKVLAQRQLA